MSETIGTLFVIAAASGSGKTSLVNALLQSTNRLKVSVSHTTRSPRVGEKDGENYFFTTVEEFEDMIQREIFLEHAQVFGNFYGTSKEWVSNELNKGIDVILEIDWQGAQQVRRLLPDSVGIFIFPPSFEVLKKRLIGRNLDEPDVIAKRLQEASKEIAHSDEFDYWVVNDVFEEALKDLRAIIRSRRLRREVQVKRQSHLLADLLQNQ